MLFRVQIQARRFLCRHYYPEGGWGWVITVCALLVNLLNHGVQLSCSQLVHPAAFKFHVPAVYPAGKAHKTRTKSTKEVQKVFQLIFSFFPRLGKIWPGFVQGKNGVARANAMCVFFGNNAHLVMHASF